jgi:glycosyltransferase involved in cell wall biosynthesis
VIYNAERILDVPVRTRRFHEAFGLAASKKILLLQGGLSSGRNLEVLVNAMRYVKNTSVVLVILGDGFLLSKLQAKVKSQAENVYFHPAVPQKDLLSFTVAADAGVIPYQATCLNNYFCTPNKLFEFIAAGIPILASDLPEIRNMVIGEQIGMVGDMSTPVKLAVLIDEFFADEQRLATWQMNVSVARKHICWEEEEKKLVAIYETLR